ncbi:amidohydrolase, partial [Stenotrophomonas maltophilia]
MMVLKQLAQSAAKGSRAWFGATVMVLACISASAQAQDLLVRNATVHTASARGSLH